MRISDLTEIYAEAMGAVSDLETELGPTDPRLQRARAVLERLAMLITEALDREAV